MQTIEPIERKLKELQAFVHATIEPKKAGIANETIVETIHTIRGLVAEHNNQKAMIECLNKLNMSLLEESKFQAPSLLGLICAIGLIIGLTIIFIKA